MTAIKLPPKPKPKPVPRSGPAFKKEEYVFLDFETEAIDRRPAYPPKPVGFAAKWSARDRAPRYWAWGHPDGNNCTQRRAFDELRSIWNSGLPIVCQNGKFDLEVAEHHFGLPIPDWRRNHDTCFLLFLHDPHASSFSLKPSAERILGIKPKERDELRDWVLANVKGAKASDWGAYIAKAPGELVGRYAAQGDIVMTEKLFYHLMKYVHDHDMVEAYNRERRVMPIFLRNEQVGIRLDVDALERDVVLYEKALEYADNWIRKRVKVPGLNIDADKDFGEALAAADAVAEWTWTKGGHGRAPQRSVSKTNLLISHFRDHKLALVYAYRNRLTTCLSMFMRQWLEFQRGGYLSTEWNQVRRGDKGNTNGTRSGRPSTKEPNFLAISKSFEDKDDGYTHPNFCSQLPVLPLVRKYLLPDQGQVWGHRDYNQQELRLVAHFENATLKERYNERPWRKDDGEMSFDIHSAVQLGILELTGESLHRRNVKIINFADIYGRGLTALAEALGTDMGTATQFRKAKDALMPGVAQLVQQVKWTGQQGKSIRTWGGREYFAEKSTYSKKYDRVMDFYYKLFNYLIQTSAADVTKEALIRYDAHPKREGRFLVTVYDEVNSSMPSSKAGLNQENRVLRESMESVECGVPMLSDGKTGINWGIIESCWKKLPSEREEWVVSGDKWW